MAKKWWLSRTLLVNAVSLVAMAGAELVRAQTAGEIAIPAKYYPWIVMAINLVNGYLRTVTTKPIQ